MTIYYILVFLFGLAVGSFINVVIWRLHTGQKIGNARSECPQCHHQLSPLDLVPVVSFLWLKGKCRYCQNKISWQYPVVEFVTALLFLLSFVFNLRQLPILDYNFQFLIFNFQVWLKILRDWVFICFLIIIFIYDLKWYLILDRVTIPAIVVAFIFNLVLGYNWLGLLIAAGIGFAFFFLQFVLSSGQWLGGGDLRLGILMGLMFGWPVVIFAIFLSYIIGAVVAVFLLVGGKKGLKSQVPLGTFLAVGSVASLFWGQQVVNWYLSKL